jgi:hypothetical protein
LFFSTAEILYAARPVTIIYAWYNKPNAYMVANLVQFAGSILKKLSDP